MTSRGSKTRIKWEGDTQRTIRSWPKGAKENLGNDLSRLERRENPLDSKPMGKSLPGVTQLRDEDDGVCFRVLYTLDAGWIYVLDCFTKKTNKTSKHDIKLAKKRLSDIKARKDAPYIENEHEEEHEDE